MLPLPHPVCLVYLHCNSLGAGTIYYFMFVQHLAQWAAWGTIVTNMIINHHVKSRESQTGKPIHDLLIHLLSFPLVTAELCMGVFRRIPGHMAPLGAVLSMCQWELVGVAQQSREEARKSLAFPHDLWGSTCPESWISSFFYGENPCSPHPSQTQEFIRNPTSWNST